MSPLEGGPDPLGSATDGTDRVHPERSIQRAARCMALRSDNPPPRPTRLGPSRCDSATTRSASGQSARLASPVDSDLRRSAGPRPIHAQRLSRTHRSHRSRRAFAGPRAARPDLRISNDRCAGDFLIRSPTPAEARISAGCCRGTRVPHFPPQARDPGESAHMVRHDLADEIQDP